VSELPPNSAAVELGDGSVAEEDSGGSGCGLCCRGGCGRGGGCMCGVENSSGDRAAAAAAAAAAADAAAAAALDAVVEDA
jgi:hypothetical protein